MKSVHDIKYQWLHLCLNNFVMQLVMDCFMGMNVAAMYSIFLWKAYC